jgi:hypothetical protein
MAVAEGLDKGVVQELVSKGRKRKGGDEAGEGASASASERGESGNAGSGGKRGRKRRGREEPTGGEKVKIEE